MRSVRIPVFRERKTSLDQTPEAVVLYYSGAFAPAELGFALTEHQVRQSPNGWNDKLRMCSRFMDWLANFPAYAQWHESVRSREDRFVIAYIDGRPEEARYHTAESFGSLPATRDTSGLNSEPRQPRAPGE